MLVLFGLAVVLARLLSPDDYAIMAFIVPVVGLVQFAQGLGIPNAIVRAREISKAQLDALFGLVMGMGLLLALVVALAGPVLARWLMGIEIGLELAVASSVLLFSALGLLPGALLARSLMFKATALRNIAATAIGGLAAVAIAAIWHSHWALIANLILVPLLQFLGSAIAIRWRPGLPKSFEGLGEMMGFGLKIWGTNILIYASHNADNLIVAGSVSPYQLGIYDRSYRALAYPLNQAVGPLGNVLVPSMTRVIDDFELYRGYYWRAVTALLVACLPGLALVATFPGTIIGLLLGPAWLDGAPLFGWFALAAMFEIFATTLNWHMQSQGRGGDMLRGGVVTAVVGLGAVAIGIRWGILGVAIGFLLARALLRLPVMLWLAGRAGPVRHRELIAGAAPHAIATAAVLGLLAAGQDWLGPVRWPALIGSAFLAYAAYLAVVCAFPASRALVLGLARRGLAAVGR